jgi:hypothetical protein
MLELQPQLNLMTVEGAVKYLNPFRLPLTFSQAMGYLRGLWHSANLLALYRHYFPAEFAASRSSDSIEILHSSSKGLACLYSPKEKEFLKLVDARLFPFYADHLLDEEEEREDLIYLPNFGVDWWTNEFEELEWGWQLLLFVTGSVQRDLGLKIEDCTDQEIGAALQTIQGFNVRWDLLSMLSATRAEPLCFLPIALDMLEHDTGNIFLDPTDETPAEPLEWSIEDMDFLIEQYKQAGILNEKANQLLDWLTASPVHFREVVNLWNECQQPAATTGSQQ